jgi:hypothetical protein
MRWLRDHEMQSLAKPDRLSPVKLSPKKTTSNNINENNTDFNSNNHDNGANCEKQFKARVYSGGTNAKANNITNDNDNEVNHAKSSLLLDCETEENQSEATKKKKKKKKTESSRWLDSSYVSLISVCCYWHVLV